MFNLFKKKEDPIASIFSGTTTNQKMSIVNFLLFAASSDVPKGNPNQETAILNRYVDILKVDGGKAMSYFEASKWTSLLSDLRALSQSQKEFFIIMAFEMINCDGQMNDAEEQFLSSYFEKLGFSEQFVLNTITKAQAMMADLYR
jgi:hypothetical protein